MSKKKESKKSEEQKELEKRYKTLFKDVVEVIQKEKNVGLVYQVLIDITSQLENELRSHINECGECNHDCSNCGSDE